VVVGELAVDRLSLADRAAEVLREQILSGAFQSGSRLIEARLAESLRVSRGTVRTALKQLSHEGLVETTPFTGWAVAQLSDRDAWELCLLREVLEGLAARLAAQSISPNSIERLKRAFQQLTDAARSGSRAAVVTADLALHKSIMQLSGNRRLVQQYDLIEQQLKLYIALSDLRSVDLWEVVEWHKELVEAILAGDAERAERAAKDNATKNGQELVRQLKSVTAEEATPSATDAKLGGES
jgi:DNA-binding GntR family transcriptional regulator